MKNPKCMVVSKCLCISLAYGFPLGLRGPLRGTKIIVVVVVVVVEYFIYIYIYIYIYCCCSGYPSPIQK